MATKFVDYFLQHEEFDPDLGYPGGSVIGFDTVNYETCVHKRCEIHIPQGAIENVQLKQNCTPTIVFPYAPRGYVSPPRKKTQIIIDLVPGATVRTVVRTK